MRVFWVVRTFGLGGAERLLLEVLPHLDGLDVRAFAPTTEPRDLVPFLEGAGVRARTLMARTPADVRWIARLRRHIRTDRPDLIHLMNPVTGAGGRIAALGLDVPVIYTEQGEWGGHRRLSRWANALTYGLSDSTTAVSEAVRRSVARHPLGRRHAGRIRVIPNAVDVAAVRAEALGEPSLDVPAGAFGTVGHLARVKGPDVLLSAAALIQRRRPGHRCVIVGGGPLEREMRSLAARMGVDAVFAGIRPDARRIASRLAVYVQPSRSEGLPLALLEAMALGRPVVATRVGGIPDVVTDGETGLLVAPEDPRALADAVLRLLDDPELSSRLGMAASESVERSWDARATASALLELYAQVGRR